MMGIGRALGMFLIVGAAARIAPAQPVLAHLPLHFEPEPGGGFLARSAGGMLELAADSVRGPVALRLEDARRNARMEGVQLLAGQSHYLIGNDPKKWRTHVPNYARVRVRNAWPGIDVIYYGNRGGLEFDFVVAAGADPSRIQFVAERGRLRDPVIYQDTAAGRQLVAGRYSRHGSRVAFELARYDHTRPLVIDPVIEYSTALGGGASDTGSSIAVDASGAAYVFGITYSGNFPVKNAFQASAFAGSWLFVAKLAPDGGSLEYSTYLGGSGYPRDTPGGIAVDSSGHATVTGTTGSADFPIAGPAPLQKTFVTGRGTLDGFATRLSADGSTLIYSTFLGTGGGNQRVAVDRGGDAYLTGSSNDPNFPAVNPLPGASSTGLYAIKLLPDGTAVYSTFLGIFGYPTGIAADNDGNAYITGAANAQGFPLVNSLQGAPPSYVTKLNASGSALIYSTFFGVSSGDSISAIAADSSGNAYIVGTTASLNFPTVNALQPRLGTAAMYKSTDGGATGARIDQGLPGAVTEVAVDPTNSAAFVLGSAPGTGFTGLYRSDNGGAGWGAILTGVSTFALDPVNSGTIYAGQGNALMKTGDGGATWTKLFANKGTLQALAIDPKNPTTIFAGYGGGDQTDGVYKSSDGGSTFTPVFIGSMHGVRWLALGPTSPSTIYVEIGCGFCSEGTSNFYRSTDGGQSWAPVTQFYGYPVFDPDNPSVVYVAEGSLWKSTDGGQTFVQYKVAQTSIGSIAIDPQNTSTLYAGAPDGVYKSTDGGETWAATAIHGNISTVAIDPQSASTVYAGASVASNAFVAKFNPQGLALVYSTYLGGSGSDSGTAIAVDASGNAYVIGSTTSADFPSINPLPASLNSGGQFLTKIGADGSGPAYSTRVNARQLNAVAVDATGAVYLTGTINSPDFPVVNGFQGFTSGTLFRSSDGGGTWTRDRYGNPFTASILNLVLDPHSSSLLFAQTSNNIYRSTDGAASFLALNVPFNNILSMAWDPATSTLYAGTGSGAMFGIYKSADNGQTWTRIGDLSFVNAIAIAPNSPSTVFAATDGGLEMTTDGGAHWTQSGSFSNVYTVVFDPRNAQTLYASAANDGIFKSTDGGAHWTAINNGFPNAGGPAARVLALDPLNDSVVYATGRDGIFRSINGGASWAEIDAGLRVRQGYWVSAFAIDPVTTSTLYAGLDSGGLYKSTDDGGSWTLTGLTVPSLTGIVLDPNAPGHILTGGYFNPTDAFVVKIGQ